ncbi:hypothetical protein ACQPWW_22920 [Micromonospora sp. CA-240977]|uniref:hypothetical protein n=1 Tax=Micromonospora sp. CA-240977 TaxID=3239957 RepID=UPI003D8D241A
MSPHRNVALRHRRHHRSRLQRRSARVIRPGGMLVSVVGPVEARPVNGSAVDLVVEFVPSQLV